MKKYYEAYDERYKTIHEKGFSWSSDIETPIVLKTIKKYNIQKNDSLLEIGCGEGRDANKLFDLGYNLLATDISPEAIRYCQSINTKNAKQFRILDCLSDDVNDRYDFIYAVAVIHMLVLNEDRQKFYSFIHKHLKKNGLALICSMGDGKIEMQTDIDSAFVLQKREHPSGEVDVAATSCRMISFDNFRKEIINAGLIIVEEGITDSLPEFNSLMFAVVRKKD